MMWDVVIFVVVVFGMFAYWLVSSLRQRGLFRTLFAMLKGLATILTLGYIGSAKAVEIHNQLSARGFGKFDGMPGSLYTQFRESPETMLDYLWNVDRSD